MHPAGKVVASVETSVPDLILYRAAAVDSDGTPRKKAATGKRGAATATAEGSPTKKSKTRKGKALKADMAAEVEQREAEDDEDAGTEPNEDGEAF